MGNTAKEEHPGLQVKAIRGAVQIESDLPELIANGTVNLLGDILMVNELQIPDFISLFFWTTPDLLSEIPALAANEAGWAAIEPGVTQSELSEALSGTSQILNVTASSAHTSVVGNAVDRGAGLRRQRTEALAGLEVARRGGQLLRAG